MTEIEKLKRRIELKFQYIKLLGDKIDETRAEIRELQDKLVLLHPASIKCCSELLNSVGPDYGGGNAIYRNSK